MALGDSITAGAGSVLNQGYAVLYRRILQNDLKRNVRLQNLGKNGWTSQDLLHDLVNNPAHQEAIKKAQVITLSIGGNDLLKGVKNNVPLEKVYERFARNFHKIDRIIKKLKRNAKEPYIIRYLEIYNPRPNDPLAQKWIPRFNRVIHRARDKNTRIAQTHRVFAKEGKKLLFIDRKHPNIFGHRAIARTLKDIGHGALGAEK